MSQMPQNMADWMKAIEASISRIDGRVDQNAQDISEIRDEMHSPPPIEPLPPDAIVISRHQPNQDIALQPGEALVSAPGNTRYQVGRVTMAEGSSVLGVDAESVSIRNADDASAFNTMVRGGNGIGIDVNGSDRVQITRCITLDRRGEHGSHGIYFANANDLTIRDTLIDHCGWFEQNGELTAGRGIHGIYAHSGDNVLIEGCIITRSGANAVRPGADVDYIGNFIALNGIGLELNRPDQIAQDNAVLYGAGIGKDREPRGWGIVTNPSRCNLHNNIVANQLPGNQRHLPGISAAKGWSDISVSTDNTVHAWGIGMNEVPEGVEYRDAALDLPWGKPSDGYDAIEARLFDDVLNRCRERKRGEWGPAFEAGTYIQQVREAANA